MTWHVVLAVNAKKKLDDALSEFYSDARDPLDAEEEFFDLLDRTIREIEFDQYSVIVEREDD